MKPAFFRSLSPAVLCLAVSLAGGSGVAEAGVYVPISDAALVDRAPLAIVGTIATNGEAGERITAYEVVVERTLKGSLQSSRIVVEVPGNERFVVVGMPRFAPGERVLLFLEARAGSSYRLVELMLGAFWEIRLKGSDETRAERDLTESTALGDPASEPSRDFAAFASWVEARARGNAGPESYRREKGVLETEEGRAAGAPYTFLSTPPARWTQFDTGGKVTWVLRPGTTNMASGGEAPFQAAVSAFNAQPRTIFNLDFEGTNTRAGSFYVDDGLNAVIIGDPFSDIPDSFNCSTGGVLAIGGYSTRGTHIYKGTSHGTILEADIVMQDGADCAFVAFSGKYGEQVFGHELGHTVGLGHSCGQSGSPCNTGSAQNDALMRAYAHSDNRGARFGSDDIEGLVRLYERTMISVNDATVNEGNSGTATLTFTVSLSKTQDSTVSVQYATADSTDPFPANSGTDYNAATGTLTFAVGETSKALNVTVISDTRFELNETFVVNLSSASNATILDNQGNGTITNDDSRSQPVFQTFFAVDPRETPMVGDFNGDNKTDIITFARSSPASYGDVFVALSSGTGFGPSSKWHDFFAINPIEVVVIGDYDGDGKDDIATRLYSQIYVARSLGNGMAASTLWNSNTGRFNSDLITSGDANGDGKDDLIMFARTDGKVYVATSDGTRFGAPTVWHPFFAVSTYERPRVGDVNGDGKADIITFATDSPSAFGDVYTAVSDGSSFRDVRGGQNSDKWHDFFAIRPNEEIRVGDLNKDGKADFFTFLPRPFAQCYTVLSQGTSMAGNVLWPQEITALDADKPFVGDVNGDGKADIIIFAQSEGKVYVSIAP